MTVCYFGDYNKNYSRNKILIRGLELNGVSVLECHTSFRGLRGFYDLWKKYRKVRNRCDVIVVGYSDSRSMVALARFISGKRVIWDAFYSLYDSYVFDRKLVSPNSLKAKYYWTVDWLASRLSHIILLDTEQHIDYFVKEFRADKNKFRRIWIGAQDDIFLPKEGVSNDKFTIIFYGYFIPLQGIQYILKAAKILEDVDLQFMIIGSGQETPKVLDLSRKLELKNVKFIDRIGANELVSWISKSDLCLGIFGDTPKTKRVIPNKLYECLSMKKPVITSDTPAIRELFDDKELILVPTANPQELADAILKLKGSSRLRNEIAENGYKKFKNNASPIILGAQLKQIVDGI